MVERSTQLLPPFSDTGVETRAVPGWFAGSAVADGDDESLASGLVESLRRFLPGVVIRSRNGSRHYAFTLARADGSFAVLYGGLGGASGSVMVQVRQSAFEGLSPDGGAGLLAWCCANLRPSRLDVALDDGAARVAPGDLYDGRLDAVSRTHRGGWEWRQNGAGGSTLYVGSRQSERYLRVYVKAAGGRAWVRHEVELKGSVALGAAESVLAGQSLVSLWAAEAGRIARWPDLPGWVSLMASVDGSCAGPTGGAGPASTLAGS